MRTLVSSDPEVAVAGSAAYNDTERENVGGFVHATPRMRFRTTPHPVANLFIENVVSRRHTGRIFNIGKLDLRDLNFMLFLLPIDYDVVRREFPRLNHSTLFEFVDGKLTSPFIQFSSTGLLRLHVFGNAACLDLSVDAPSDVPDLFRSSRR